MQLKRKAAIATIGMLGFAGLAGGTALAQTGRSSVPKPPPITTQNGPTSTAPQAPPQPGGDTNEQRGDQTAPDTPGGAEEKEAPAAAEHEKPEEKGDANLPGGGHADPPGNVDHQFEGVE